MQTMTRSLRSSFGSFIVDRHGTLLGFDEAMEQLTGWPAADVVGRNKAFGSVLAVADLDVGNQATHPLYEGEIELGSGSRNRMVTLRSRDGRRFEVETAIERLAGPGERMLVTVLRVLARSAEAGDRDDRSRFDGLTGLLDREAFASRLGAEFQAALCSSRPLAVIVCDIDHLREVNDRLGFEAGDEVLGKVAGVLRAAIEDETRVARIGDDEFGILLPGGGRGDARQVAAGLRSAVERFRFFDEDRSALVPRVTLSLGAASFPADADGESELMERAHEALEEARQMGRNRVWCYLRRPRVPVEVPVYFDGVESLLVGYTRDLSPSGIFVQTASTIDVGMRCALAFPLPGYDRKVHVIGRIVRTVPPEMSLDTATVRIPGIGVEFERFGGDSDRRAIDAFLHSNESLTLRPEGNRFSV